VYNFKKISFDALKQYLESIAKNESVDVDNDVIERIINKSDGCARDAVSLLDQLMASGEKTITADVASLVLPTSNIDSVLSFVRALFDKDAKEMLALVDAAREDGVHIDQLMHDIIEIVRTIMIQKVNPNAIGSMDINETAKKELSRMGKTLNMNELIGLIDLLIQRKKEIKTAPLPHLPLEMVVIVWCAGTPIKSNMDQEPPPSSTPDAPQQQTEPPPTKTTPAKTQEQEHAPPQKETIKQKVKNIVSKTSEVTIEDVRNIWEDYIHRLEELYPSFVFILRMASIIKVEHNTVELGVAYSFHKDKRMDTVCKKNLETVLSEILNSSVSLAATVQKEEEHAEPRKEDTELQELASAFGGKIVQ
jgi:DNA polymerase-3 subunit gamma/tau